MSNNQASDRYNPQGILVDDFDTMKFSALDVNNLFWLHGDRKENNPAFRKLDERSALHTVSRQIIPIKPNLGIFIKI